MPKKNLTARFCESVKVAERTDFQDVMVHGLSLRVTPQGTKTWNLRYVRESDGVKQRVTLGRFPAVPLEKARTAALKAAVSIADGVDPATENAVNRDSITVQELGNLFIEKYAKRQKKTWPENERMLRVEVYPKIGRKKARAVKRRDLLDIVEAKAESGAVSQSTQILAVVRKMFNWAVRTIT